MKKAILAIIILAIIGYFGYNYVMAAPTDVSNAKADIEMDATSLAAKFSENEIQATKTYQEKIIEVSGKVTSIDGKSVTLDKKVSCVFTEEPTVKINDEVKIKGLFIGFDEMFEEVKLDQSTLVE